MNPRLEAVPTVSSHTVPTQRSDIIPSRKHPNYFGAIINQIQHNNWGVISTRESVLPPMFEDLDIGIAVHDPETGAIVDVNDSLEQLYGYSAAELREMEVGEYTAPSRDFSHKEAVRRIQAVADGTPQEFDWQIERANGDLQWVSVTLKATTIHGQNYVIAEVDEGAGYQDRQQRIQLLHRIVRHNLRNKINVIQGHAELLEAVVEDDASVESVEAILEAAMDVQGISDSVTTLEEIGRTGPTQHTIMDLPRITRSVLDEIRGGYPDADIDVVVESDVRVIADSSVRYALAHAVENAIEHDNEDQPSVTVTVTTDHETDQGVVRVVDEGPPIPDIEIDVLNEDFEPSSTRHGSGVGLPLMQACVSTLGGELSFAENDPRGNVVSIALPRPEPV
ncbi:sensor histidine kinase [Natronoarchaeum rubrum]|uniref:sensor histidine kinase n=1 Tax=Natronoarchaeum rubrum TaxID=755311 RepID=UPI00211119B7|nr:PAS domain-containing sensor histidine kinase [Natronoarchaeum rubrum]